MAAQRPGKPVRSGRVEKSSKKPSTAVVPAKQSVSAASVFKQQLRNTKEVDTEQKPTVAKSGTASRSSYKVREVARRKQSEPHPLSVDFKKAADGYREELYRASNAKLESIRDNLISSLHESNLTVSPSPYGLDPDASPVKLTVQEKHDRMAQKLFRPIGSTYSVITRRKNKNGELEEVKTPLHEMLEEFETRHKEDMEEIKELQRHWERVVGEIYKLGVECLDERTMSSIFFTQPPSSPVHDDAGTELLSLFVPEHGDSPIPVPKAPKKRVAFKTAGSSLPSFVSEPSVFLKKHPLPKAARVSDEEAKELEKRVNQLGIAQLEELENMERDQKNWEKKKMEQITSALNSD